MAQREPVARIEVSLPMDRQECAINGLAAYPAFETAKAKNRGSSRSSASLCELSHGRPVRSVIRSCFERVTRTFLAGEVIK
jgi:hypothetical protein